MISIICICNNRRVYNEYLAKSLKKQRECSYEILVIDNEGNRFKNAISAFNSVIPTAKGDYLLFVHQDFALEDDYFLNKIEAYFKQYPQTGIVGVAGVKEGVVYSNIYHSLPRILASEKRIEEPTEVNGLDECLFVIPKTTLLKHPFDEITCDNWHFYTVEYCYQMKSLNKAVVVLPLDAYHLSIGDFMNEGYYDSLVKVAKKYHSHFSHIDTTLRRWSTNPLVLNLNIQYLRFKKAKMKKSS